MSPTPSQPAAHPDAPFCPLYRAEYKGNLQKLTLKIQTLPPEESYIEGHLMWQKQPILLRGKLTNRLGRLTLMAYLSGTVVLACRHTGKTFSWQLQEMVTETLDSEEEPELFVHGLLNLAEWVRQQVELAIPAYPQSPQAERGLVRVALQQEEDAVESKPFSILKCLMMA